MPDTQAKLCMECNDCTSVSRAILRNHKLLGAESIQSRGSVQEHIRAMTELFEALAVIDDPVSDEDQVVNLLASLRDQFNTVNRSRSEL